MTAKDQLPNLKGLVEEFQTANRAAGHRAGTIEYYRNRLGLLLAYCKIAGTSRLDEITPAFINEFLLWLDDTGHSQGGKFGCFRSLRTLINWYIRTYEPDAFRNPIQRVKAPTKPKALLEPIPLDNIRALIAACPDFRTGVRDRAILFFLLDTGVRAAELTALDFADVNIPEGSAVVRHGKGDKRRMVFIGTKAKKALRKYLPERRQDEPALFQTEAGERMTYWTLKDLLVDRAEKAGVPRPSLHAFRRTFALEALRNGMNVYTLQRLMGHATLDVTRVYLNQSPGDLQLDHLRASPADKL